MEMTIYSLTASLIKECPGSHIKHLVETRKRLHGILQRESMCKDLSKPGVCKIDAGLLHFFKTLETAWALVSAAQ